jgi:hypothetical protein
LKRFVQSLQAALVCTVLVALIFSIPVVMAATPIHLDISYVSPVNFLTEHWAGAGHVPPEKF